MSEPIIVVQYNPNWKAEFLELGTRIRESLGSIAIRIDHIGSTSILGLDAKPIIDIQVSVDPLDPIDSYKHLLERIGFQHRADNPDLTKRYFREIPGKKRVHLHVRESGSWSEQTALLFRDYLRCHTLDCLRYAEEKYRLMEIYKNEREKYVEEKEPIIWDILRRASKWSQEIGWKPGITDI
jgi:GrpB-like predicted nucleotidyltransferase (UPF0157 family)